MGFTYLNLSKRNGTMYAIFTVRPLIVKDFVIAKKSVYILKFKQLYRYARIFTGCSVNLLKFPACFPKMCKNFPRAI